MSRKKSERHLSWMKLRLPFLDPQERDGRVGNEIT